MLSPPVFTEGPREGEISFEAPYARWTQHGAFDSATECGAGSSVLARRAKEAMQAMKADDKETRILRWFAVAAAAARCVATDDPRLSR